MKKILLLFLFINYIPLKAEFSKGLFLKNKTKQLLDIEISHTINIEGYNGITTFGYIGNQPYKIKLGINKKICISYKRKDLSPGWLVRITINGQDVTNEDLLNPYENQSYEIVNENENTFQLIKTEGKCDCLIQ